MVLCGLTILLTNFIRSKFYSLLSTCISGKRISTFVITTNSGIAGYHNLLPTQVTLQLWGLHWFAAHSPRRDADLDKEYLVTAPYGTLATCYNLYGQLYEVWNSNRTMQFEPTEAGILSLQLQTKAEYLDTWKQWVKHIDKAVSLMGTGQQAYTITVNKPEHQTDENTNVWKL
jgi:hypothetical protein